MEWTHLEEVLNRYGNELCEGYKDNLRKDDINASGDLAQSVKYIVEKNDTSFEVSLSLADYWKYVENGRRAGKMPPINKIERWIKVKPVLPRAYNGKVPTEKQLAFLIARKIGREGTEARHTLSNTVKDINEKFMLEIEKAFIEDFGKQIDEVLTLLLNA